MAIKKIVVEFAVDVEDFENCIVLAMNDASEGVEITDFRAFRDELQACAYDEGGMAGNFQIKWIEDSDMTMDEWCKQNWGK